MFKKLYIAVVVGHSRLKNGNYTSADGKKFKGVNEYKFCKNFAKYVARYLRKNGHIVDVIQCPEKVFTKSTQERNYKLDIINDNDYDLVIELHLNASSDPSAEGCEVLYISDAGKEYAQKIHDALTNVIEPRGVKYRDNLYMLTQTDPVAVIVETFFCTNKKEWKYVSPRRVALAKRLANSIDK